MPSNILNVYFDYTFYWIDYQRYVFQGMIFNEFTNREFRLEMGVIACMIHPWQASAKLAEKLYWKAWDTGTTIRDYGLGF